MIKAYDRNIYLAYQKPLVQATGMVVLSEKSTDGRYYGVYFVKGAYGYKSVHERKEIIYELMKEYRIDNHVVTISIVPN